MSESEKAQSETGSSRTTSNLNESVKIKENKQQKSFSSVKKSFSRYQQDNDEDLDDENKSQNLTSNQSQKENKPEIQMIENAKINKKSLDVSYVNSEDDYQKKFAIILSEKKTGFNDSQRSDPKIEVEQKSPPSQNYASSHYQSQKQSIEIVSFERQSKKNKKKGEQSMQVSHQGESAKNSSKESILMSKHKTQVPLKNQDSFKGFQYFDNLDQYEVKLKKKQNIFKEKSQDDDGQENYYEGKQLLKSRSPSKSAGEESDQTDDFRNEAQIRKHNLGQNLTVDKFKSQKQSSQPQQYQKYQNNFERQFDKPQMLENQKIQQKRLNNSNQPPKKVDNIQLASYNLRITQDLLQKAKDKRLNALKQIDLDNEKYQNKLSDLKNKKQKKSMNNNQSLKQITERSEHTQFSDTNSLRRDINLKAKTIKWKKGESNNKPVLKNYQKEYVQIEKEQMNSSIPRENNIKKTYRWLISQYDELEDKYNLKSHSTQNNSYKDQKYSNYLYDKVKRQEVPKSQSIESRNSNLNQMRSRSASYEGTYNKRKSPDQKQQYEQKMYEYQQKQFKSTPVNQIQLTNQNKQSKVVKALDSLGLQSQFAERLYRNHNFVNTRIPDKIDYDVVQKHKSYSNNERKIVQSPKKVQLKEQEKVVPKLNQSMAVMEKRIDEVLKTDFQNPKSKFNIERISYDQFKSQQDNYVPPTPTYPLNQQVQNLQKSSDLQLSQRKPIESISNQPQSLNLMKIKCSSPVTKYDLQDYQLEKQEGQQSIRNMFTSLGYQGQTNLNMSNSQTWMPQIYAELCKSRALIAKKDIEIKQFEQDLQSKNNQLEVMQDIKQNYQSLQEIFDEQKIQYEIKEKELDSILNQKEEEYLLKEQELRQLFIQKEEDYHLKEYEFRSILIQKDQVIEQFQIQKEEEFENFQIQKDLEQKQLQLDQIEIFDKFESLINSQNQYKNLNNTLTIQSQDQQLIYQKQEMKDQFTEIINKLQDLFTDIQNEVKKKEKENKRILSQEIKELEERVEAMNQNFEQLEQQKEDQERVIDSLKQIIMLQEKLKTSEFNQFNNEIRTQVIKGIEDIMVEEQSKQMLAKLAWVSQLSDKTLSRDNLNLTQKEDLRLSVDEKLQKNQSQPSSFEDVQTNDMQDMMQSQMSIQVQNDEKQCREVIVQTEMDLMSEFKEEIISNNSKNTQLTKKFKVLSNDIKQNMNEILNEQLKGFLQTNVNEIANLKIENERINEKYSQEKQKVEILKQELQKKNKYQQYYENHKVKKYRNCGVQVGQSKFKDFSVGFDNSKEILSDISNLAISQNYQNEIVNKNKENTLGQIKISIDKSLKISEKNGSQDLSSSQFSKYDYQVQSKSQNQKKNKLKTQNTRLSKSNFDEDSYNITQSQIQIVDQKKLVNEQDILKFQIKQNQKLYLMLKTYVQNHGKSSEDTKRNELQQNLIILIEKTANKSSDANIYEKDNIGKAELIKSKSGIFGVNQDDISKSDLMQSWDEFSQEQNLNQNAYLQSSKGEPLQSSIQKSKGSEINKSQNPTEKTIKQKAELSIEQRNHNQKLISFENSQQIYEGAYLPNENQEMVQSFQNIKYSFANKLQGLQNQIQKYGADK